MDYRKSAFTGMATEMILQFTGKINFIFYMRRMYFSGKLEVDLTLQRRRNLGEFIMYIAILYHTACTHINRFAEPLILSSLFVCSTFCFDEC